MKQLVLISCLLLAGCGFRPLYGTQGLATTTPALQSQLGTIDIKPIPDRSGVVLRNALIDRFHTHGTPQHPAYTLTVAPITEAREGLDITIDEETTRTQLRLSTTLTLIDNATQDIILTRPIYTLASYNVLESQFTTRVSANNARDNGLYDLARQIEQAVILTLRAPRP